MLLLQSSFYAIALGFCVLCILCVSHSRNRIPLRFFVAYLVLEAIGFACEWLMAHPSVPWKSLWLTGVMGLSLFIAPCLWLYAREIIERESPATNNLSRWHTGTVVIGLMLLLPLLSSTHGGSDFFNAAEPTTLLQDLTIHSSMLVVVMIFLVQTLVYLKLCKDILLKRNHQNLALFASIDDPALNTLRILMVAVVANWLVSALRVLNCITPGDDQSFVAVFAGLQTLIITYVIVAVFKQEAGFSMRNQEIRNSLESHNGADIKYAHSALGRVQRMRIQQKLTHAMQIEHRYRDNEINLPALCDHIGEGVHPVSQVINESDYPNFYDLINRHRVSAAKELLLHRPEKTVLEIAYAVGFNSKSTFNAAFKRYVQATPTQFRQAKCSEPISAPASS